MDNSAQWTTTQEFGVGKSISMGGETARATMERKLQVRPQKEVQALNCPRCHSTNTKFCYYNNYSLTQPRYLCKTCRRYWTEGGTLRNVPVGGGSRKNKRYASATTPPPPQPHKHLPADLNPPSTVLSQFSSQNLKIHDDLQAAGHDLNLGIFQVDYHHHQHQHDVMHASSSAALDFLRINGIAARGFNSYMPMQQQAQNSMEAAGNVVFASAGFPFLQESKPFPNDDVTHQYGNPNLADDDDDQNGRTSSSSSTLMFALGASKRNSTTSSTEGADHDQNNKLAGAIATE